MDTNPPTIIDKIRGAIGSVAWRVFLWSISMTDEQYDYYVHIGCEPIRETRPIFWRDLPPDDLRAALEGRESLD
jgi:hypothetical protein